MIKGESPQDNVYMLDDQPLFSFLPLQFSVPFYHYFSHLSITGRDMAWVVKLPAAQSLMVASLRVLIVVGRSFFLGVGL